MKRRISRVILVSAIVLPAAAIALWGDRFNWPYKARPIVQTDASATSSLRAIFFDVGQGDSILLRDSEGNDFLVDGGPNDRVAEKLGRYLPPTDRTIEYLVLSHPHADHLNGLPDLLQRYRVEKVIMTGVEHDSSAYRLFREEIRRQGIPTVIVVSSTTFSVGDLKIMTLWPRESWAERQAPNDNIATGGGLNDTSIVIRASYGESDLMLMGDASSAVESELIKDGVRLDAEVLKVGHHGSKYSSAREFLRAVRPQYAVIQVGAKNRYGHPTLQTLVRLREAGAKIYRNDLDGDVVVETDGRSISVRTEK